MQKICNLLSDMKESYRRLGKAIEVLESRLNTSIEGSLMVRVGESGDRFFLNSGNNHEEYLGKDKKGTIAALAQKRYEKELLKAYKTKKSSLDKASKDLEKGANLGDFKEMSKSVLEKLPKGLRELVVPYDPDEDYVNRWINSSHGERESWTRFKTMGGEYVRSKSEVIIADRLRTAGIPYFYETPIYVDNHTPVYPDFKILNRRTLQQYYWEHFGKMSDSDYFSIAQWKLETYAGLGLFPGKNLLFTFECAERSLSTEYVDALIEEYLL